MVTTNIPVPMDAFEDELQLHPLGRLFPVDHRADTFIHYQPQPLYQDLLIPICSRHTLLVPREHLPEGPLQQIHIFFQHIGLDAHIVLVCKPNLYLTGDTYANAIWIASGPDLSLCSPCICSMFILPAARSILSQTGV